MVADTQAMTIRLPVELYERLRRAAFEYRRSQNDIVQTAVMEYLDRLDERRSQ